MMNLKTEAFTDSNKAMSSYLSPLVREIPSSGIRKFLTWWVVTRTLLPWG